MLWPRRLHGKLPPAVVELKLPQSAHSQLAKCVKVTLNSIKPIPAINVLSHPALRLALPQVCVRQLRVPVLRHQQPQDLPAQLRQAELLR